jgi:UDP-N-acetylglucosamine acyltransferase
MNTQNSIARSARLVGDVELGTGNFISEGVTLLGPITIGNNNYFGPNCVLGTPPQDDVFSTKEHFDATMGNRSQLNGIEIGNNNVIREFVTVHQGLTSKTVIKSDCYLMSYAHIAHDCVIDKKVKIANNVQLGGYTTIFHDSYIGLSAVLHQFSIIGSFVMIGMGSVVTKNAPPAVLIAGAPARVIKTNRVAIQKIGISDTAWEAEYLRAPSTHSIDNKLVLDYIEYEETVALKKLQREEVTKFRETKK